MLCFWLSPPRFWLSPPRDPGQSPIVTTESLSSLSVTFGYLSEGRSMRMCRVPAVIVAAVICGAGLSACGASGSNPPAAASATALLAERLGRRRRPRSRGHPRHPRRQQTRRPPCVPRRPSVPSPPRLQTHPKSSPRATSSPTNTSSGTHSFTVPSHPRRQRRQRLWLLRQDRHRAGEGDYVREADRDRVRPGRSHSSIAPAAPTRTSAQPS